MLIICSNKKRLRLKPQFNIIQSHFKMKRYYLYIDAGQTLDESAKFFKVGVGISRQANSDFLYLTAHAVNYGHYFELWSDHVDDFLHKIANSFKHGENEFIADVINITMCSARDLVRHFKSSEALLNSQKNLIARDKFRKQINLNYRIISNLRKS